jgi:hypothetical protein
MHSLSSAAVSTDMDPPGDNEQSEIISKTDPQLQILEETGHLITSRDADVFLIPSPVVLFPPELIAEIFLALGVQHRNICVQICHAWREIAISTPRLWSEVSIALRKKKFNDQMSYFRILCERAGVLPLSVSLQFQDNRDYYPRPGFRFPRNQSPIPTLIPYLSRFKDLSLSLSAAGVESFCRLPVGSFPLLENCAIRVSIEGGAPEQLLPTTALESAPRLQRFTLKNKYPPRINLSLLRLPSHLVYLWIEGSLAPSKLLDILRQCPNLEELGQVEIKSCAPNYTSDMIVLPHLHSLDLQVEAWYSGDTFFQCFTVPSLRNFKLYIGNEGLASIPMSLKSLLLRSSCPLEHLLLTMSDIEPETLLGCLRAVPSLVSLEVQCIVYPQVLDALVFVPAMGRLGNLIPKLQTISFYGYPGGDYSSVDELFASMVESRWWPDVQGVDTSQRSGQVSRLTHAWLNKITAPSRNINANAFKRIQKLREEGLDVTLA